VLTLAEAAVHPHNVARGLLPRDALGAISLQLAPRLCRAGALNAAESRD
jgi:hypothetical protein